jgi:hypothetical protein
MIDSHLRLNLDNVVRRHRQWQLARRLALCWTAGAAVGLILLAIKYTTGWTPPFAAMGLAVAGGIAALLVVRYHNQQATDYRWIATRIEQKHPELEGLLLTAVQQDVPEKGHFSYLQQRVVHEAIRHSERHDWTDALPRKNWLGTQFIHLAALVAFMLFCRELHVPAGGPAPLPFLAQDQIAITPGDTQVERGNSLVVLARFIGTLPPTVELVMNQTNEAPHRMALTKSLADPVFGVSLAEVTNSFSYTIEYGGKNTREYHVKVYEHPRLERADAQLAYPQFTGQPPKRLDNTRRLSAVQGTRLELSLQLNKPVTSAQLVPRDKDKAPVPLQVDAQRATANLKNFPLDKTRTYDLQLVDADGRTNKVPSQFVFDVLNNRKPELKIARPRGDLRPSPLEEVAFEGTVWDDFGITRYGIAYTLSGSETRTVELGKAVTGKEKHPFKYMLKLEDLGVKPDQLLSWHVWAEDVGADGQSRRASSDLFFGEIRPFEEIFREGQASESQESQQKEPGEESQQGNKSAQLAELQKQVIIATWKLQQQHETNASTQYQKDIVVVRDSQQEAREMARESLEKAQGTSGQLWSAVIKEMEQALTHLDSATNSTQPLPRALTSEQAAYQALLKLQSREHEVAKARQRSRSRSQGKQRNQQQMEELDLKQTENRYETQSQARTPQSPERREQLQVLNRLQELARRQQDLNERMKELQTSLQEASTEAEKEEIRRRLKRLQEEQQQMLADADELKQRMESPENQSRMAEERKQLDQARNEMQRAAEAANQGSAPQALTAGTRAQRQLQQLRDEMRKQSSGEFSEDMRQMRNEAR